MKVVFPPVFSFAEMPQRPNLLAIALAKQGISVIYYDPKKNLVRQNDILQFNFPNTFKLKFANLHQPYMWFEPADIFMTISPNLSTYCHLIKNKYRKSLIVYDCADDFSMFWKQKEVDLTKYSDIVITSSSTLYEKKLKEKPEHVYLVKNAANLDNYKWPFNYNFPKDLPNNNKPIIGYIGALSYWLDYNLIKEFSLYQNEFNFVFIGKPFGVSKKTIANLPIINLGEKPYSVLPSYVNYFDCCIIPFQINQITLAADPIKLYEYFAMGKPVVSTNIPEVWRYKPYVEISPHSDSTRIRAKYFINTIKTSIKNNNKKKEIKRRKIAETNSWNARACSLIKIFEEHLK